MSSSQFCCDKCLNVATIFLLFAFCFVATNVELSQQIFVPALIFLVAFLAPFAHFSFDSYKTINLVKTP